MGSFFRTSSFLIVAMLLSSVDRPTEAEELAGNPSQRPNFVFVIGDDCTYHDLSLYGGQAKTPHLDRLAEEGMLFTRCFQAAPMCSPTRHNIYTGLYPVRSGAYPNHTFVEEGTKSIVHYLKPLGYRIALSGKKHINPKTAFPFEYSGKGNNPDFEAIDRLMAECSETKTPFCLFACSNEPHTPWNKGNADAYPPEELKLPPYFVDTPETRNAFSKYLAEVTYLDQQVGQCLALLKKHDLAENTMFVFTSEQGNSFPFAKWTCYRNGLQTAFVVRWPGVVEPGSACDALIEYVDVAPTFIEAAGGSPPEVFEGKSLVPLLTGEKTEHKDYTYGIHTTRGIINGSDHFGIRSVRNDRYSYIRNLSPENRFTNAVTAQAKTENVAGGKKDRFYHSWCEKAETDPRAAKLVHRYEHRPPEELYDMQADPHEMNNLADDPEYAAIKEELSERLDAWMTSQGDQGRQTELEAHEHQWRHRKKQ
jgi:uncharacterized sulfatase